MNPASIAEGEPGMSDSYFIHPSSFVDTGAQIGAGTKDMALLPYQLRR